MQGEDSKRILSDLKVILEDLRVELRSEENKRRNAEEEHIRGRKEWEAEEMRLIKIINNVRTLLDFSFHFLDFFLLSLFQCIMTSFNLITSTL